MDNDFNPLNDRYLIAVPVIALGLLTVVIIWFAITAPAAPPPSPLPVQNTQQADVREQRLQISDNRTVTCLVFPPAAVSCDWANSR